jgi:hypothetical protein
VNPKPLPRRTAKNKTVIAIAVSTALLLTGASALAAAPSPHAENEADHLSGLMEFGVGMLTLPAAQVCTDRTTSRCRKGDTSLMVEAWPLFRTSRRFAAGAGITLALFPTTDVPLNDTPDIKRNHRRSYFTAEGLVRWYPYSSPTWEAWVGGTGGLVVVADTYSSSESQPDYPLVGPSGVTTRTEGYTLGAAIGVDRVIFGSWTIGATFRYGFWSLPKKAEKNPFGDEASITGRNSMFLFGLTIGYRVSVY